MKKSKTQGFTLVELIIVIAIIAILASLAFMALSGETSQSRDSRRDSDLKVIEDAISTSNAKNRKIRYKVPKEGTNRATSNHPLETNLSTEAGENINGLRNVDFVQVHEKVFESTILASPARDPKGPPYIIGFLTDNLYQVFGTRENPETKIPTAIVRGTFREGSVIDVLLRDVSKDTQEFMVSDPGRFITGDVISVDNEMLVVTGYNLERSTIRVMGIDAAGALAERDDGSAVGSILHNKGTSVQLEYFAELAGSLLCLGERIQIDNGSWFTQAGATGSENSGAPTRQTVALATAPDTGTEAAPNLPAGTWTGGFVCAGTATAVTGGLADEAALNTQVGARESIDLGNIQIPLGAITAEDITIPYRVTSN